MNGVASQTAGRVWTRHGFLPIRSASWGFAHLAASDTRPQSSANGGGGDGGSRPALREATRANPLLRRVVMLMLLFLVSPAFAQTSDPTPLQFRNAAEETRFQRLTAELRCVMCQNQSLADSNAQIAHDLRREVLVLMQQGKNDAEIKRFLVDRYGDFVLYKPQVSSSTWLLWFGPLLLLAGGALVVWRLIAARRGPAGVANDDGQEW